MSCQLTKQPISSMCRPLCSPRLTPYPNNFASRSTRASISRGVTIIEPSRFVSVLFVCLGVFLGGCGAYDFLFDQFGAGISVPLIGFGATVANGVKEAVDNEGLLGILKGPFTAASAGCSASLIFGYIICLIFKGRHKRS